MIGFLDPDDMLDVRTRAARDIAVRTAARGLQAALGQQLEFLDSLSDTQYAQVPGPGCSPIGAHVRHTLDHVEALLSGVRRGLVDYEDRQRGTRLESDRSAGRQRTAELLANLGTFTIGARELSLAVRGLSALHGPVLTTPSSLSRELLFVLSHTIHHQAIMALVARMLTASVAAEFGLAPATAAHRESLRCARSA